MDTVFKLGELFCGPGGLAWGAMNADVPGMKIEHAWANDYDYDTCQTYIRNICQTIQRVFTAKTYICWILTSSAR